MDWLQRLKLTEQDEKIINKLRVCHKHFKNSDYSCAMNIRHLAKNIKNKPELNEVMSDGVLLKRYAKQIDLLHFRGKSILFINTKMFFTLNY